MKNLEPDREEKGFDGLPQLGRDIAPPSDTQKMCDFACKGRGGDTETWLTQKNEREKEKKRKGPSPNLPVHQHPSTSLQPSLYEGVARSEILDDILIFDVIDIDNMMLEVREQVSVQGQAQG